MFCSGRRALILVVVLAVNFFHCGGGSTPPPSNPAPAITSVTPASATAGMTTTTINVAVTNLIPSSTVQWNGATRTPTSVGANGFTLDVTTADLAAAGSAALSISNPPPGGGTATFTFTINPPAAPVLSAVSPSSIVPTGAAGTITVTGSNFVRNSVVNWNGSARTTSYVSNTQLTGSLTAQDVASGGSAQVTVTTPSPGGGTSSAQTVKLEYPLPVITSLSPATAVAGTTTGITLTIQGSSFYPGALVLWNGISRATSFASSTQLTASILATDLAGSAGTTDNVMVANPTPNAGISAASTFTIVNPLPVLSAISPNSGYGNTKDLLVTLTGQSLVLGSNALSFGHLQYAWDQDNPDLAAGSLPFFHYIDSTNVTFKLPTAAYHPGAGQFSVSYVNGGPGGGASNGLSFTILPTDAPVTSNILTGGCYGGGKLDSSAWPYALTGASRNLRYVLGRGMKAFLVSPPTWSASPMTDTCNNAPPGCATSLVTYALTDTGATIGGTLTPTPVALSGDGRYVAVASTTSIYRRDTCLGAAPACVPTSIAIASSAADPAISEDGRFVAYTSRIDTDPADTNGLSDVYVRDTCEGAASCTPKTVLISQGSAGTAADKAVLSPSGRFVAYRTTVGGTTPQLVLYDTCVGASGCTQATYAITDTGTIYTVVRLGGVSSSGRYVSYSAATAALVQQLYLHDTCVGASSCAPSDLLLSTNGAAAGNGPSTASVLSSDGRYVAFESDATDLVAHDTNGATDVFWRDTCLGAAAGCVPRTVRVSVDSSGVQLSGSSVVQISSDGQEIALSDLFDAGFTVQRCYGQAIFAKGPF